jgi:hypothetical protein
MAEINKPSIGVAWAETGSKVEPTDTKKNTGWVVEKPPYEWWNFIEHRQDKMLQHINQHGIAVWDASTEYIANKSYVLGSNGDIYRAVADSVGINPVGDTSNKWFRVLDNYYLKGEIDSLIAATIMPSGAIIDFAMNSAPSGYLVCNGSAISRTAFAALFARIGTLYGNGDGSTTFNLPNCQGRFRRGHNPTSSGYDAGRAFGSVQDDAIRNITGTVAGGVMEEGGTATGAFTIGGLYNGGAGGGGDRGIGFDASLVVPVADENRPANIAILTCIKV